MNTAKSLAVIVMGALGVGVLAGLSSRAAAAATPETPKKPKIPSAPGGWVPYTPTPPSVRDRALELLRTMNIGERIYEDDPTGEWGEILYSCNVHPPSTEITHSHKGVDVWHEAP